MGKIMRVLILAAVIATLQCTPIDQKNNDNVRKAQISTLPAQFSQTQHKNSEKQETLKRTSRDTEIPKKTEQATAQKVAPASHVLHLNSQKPLSTPNKQNNQRSTRDTHQHEHDSHAKHAPSVHQETKPAHNEHHQHQSRPARDTAPASKLGNSQNKQPEKAKIQPIDNNRPLLGAKTQHLPLNQRQVRDTVEDTHVQGSTSVTPKYKIYGTRPPTAIDQSASDTHANNRNVREASTSTEKSSSTEASKVHPQPQLLASSLQQQSRPVRDSGSSSTTESGKLQTSTLDGRSTPFRLGPGAENPAYLASSTTLKTTSSSEGARPHSLHINPLHTDNHDHYQFS